MSETGRELRADLDEANAAQAAARAAMRGLPQREQQKMANPGGSYDLASRRRQAAADAWWEFCGSAAADLDDVTTFVSRTGKAPRISPHTPADDRVRQQVMGMVAVQVHEAQAGLRASAKSMIAEVLRAFGHDPEDAASKAIIAAAIRRYAEADPMQSAPPGATVGQA